VGKTLEIVHCSTKKGLHRLVWLNVRSFRIGEKGLPFFFKGEKVGVLGGVGQQEEGEGTPKKELETPKMRSFWPLLWRLSLYKLDGDENIGIRTGTTAGRKKRGLGVQRESLFYVAPQRKLTRSKKKIAAP